jgi:thioredoxin reductase/NAD-dependent dihydropyrimidine dehydrogenase PreA subunit
LLYSVAMQTYLVIGAAIALAAFLYSLIGRAGRGREQKAIATLEDMAALGEVVPDTMHPVVDTNRCIGSGGCVVACPEKDVLAVVKGRAVVLNPLACVGHSACIDACPVQAIRVVFGTAKRGVELPKVDQHFQTTREGVYVIGELGGMGLIRNAVMQGKQAAEHVVSAQRRASPDAYDAAVVGAGPAGISATLRLMQAGLRVITLEREAFGGTIVHYPRAKVVMTGQLELAIVGKVGKRRMSKEELVDVWKSIADRTQLPVKVGVLVEGVERDPDGMWRLVTSAGPLRAANVLLALGRRGSPRKLEVPGEELAKVHYRLLEPTEFRGKHMLVIGGGNSAVESALSLAEAGGCASVTISYRRGAFARCRAENRRKIDEAIAQRRINALMPSELVSIGPDQAVLKVGDRPMQLRNDGIIVQIGGTAPAEILGKFQVDVETRYGR